MIESRPRAAISVYRGFCRRCPRCGRGRLFDGWYRVRSACSRCGLVYEPHDGDTYAFMYLSAAFFTGLLIVGMLFAWSRPGSTFSAAIMLAAAVVIFMVGTLPNRKGIAIALDYIVSCRCAAQPDPTRPIDPSHQREL